MKAKLSTIIITIACSALSFIQAMQDVPCVDTVDKYEYTITIPGISQKEFKDKAHGCIVGAALGDMLGVPTEFIPSRKAINKAYPPYGITGVESLKEKDFKKDTYGKKVAPYTDDTTMSILVLSEITRFSMLQFSQPGKLQLGGCN